jgi:hypothetical protein
VKNLSVKRLMGLILMSLFMCQYSAAQTRLKANLVAWMIGMPNLSVETKLARQWSFNGELLYSPWKSIEGNHFEYLKIIPEVRFYPKGVFNGFYVGGYGSFQFFDITKWNYWNQGKYQKGRGFALGLSLGYSYQINETWGLDVYAGAGWQNSQYKGYNSDGTMYKGWNGSGEWLPYRLGIALTYQF